MTYYVDAYQKVKALKREYKARLDKWLRMCERSNVTEKAALASFKRVKEALQRLNDATSELVEMVSKDSKIPDDFAVRILTE